MDASAAEPVATPSPGTPVAPNGHAPPLARSDEPKTDSGLVPPTLTRSQRRELIEGLRKAFSNEELLVLAILTFGRAADDFVNLNLPDHLNAMRLVLRAEDEFRVQDLYREARRLNDVRPWDLNDWPRRPADRSDSPYPGLSPFGVKEAANYFGREADFEKLTAHVANHSIVTLTGASGIGKSSLVFARLVPNWQGLSADFRPGADSFMALANCLLPLLKPEKDVTAQLRESRKLAAMLRANEITLAGVLSSLLAKRRHQERLLLIADQFDDWVAPRFDDAERSAFVAALFAGFPPPERLPPPAVLVLTVRADTLSLLRALPAWESAWHGTEQCLEPMEGPQLDLAIVRPAEASIALDAEVAGAIRNDLLKPPGAPFVLQLKMDRLSGLLGGGQRIPLPQIESELNAALIEHADAVVAGLAEDAPRFRSLLLHLVKRSPDGALVRHDARRSEVGEEAWHLVNRLADARLVVTDVNKDGESVVTLAHDSLVRDWPLPQQVVTGDAKFFLWLEELRTGRQAWFERREQPEASTKLLSGSDLAIAEGWLAEREADLGPDQRQFIADSRAKRDRDRQEQDDREARARQAEANQRTQRFRFLLGIIGATVLAMAVFFVLWRQTLDAQGREETARILAQEAQVTAEAATIRAQEARVTAEVARSQANLESGARASVQLAQLAEERIANELDLALLLAVEAMGEANTPQARAAVRRGLESAPRLDTILVEQDPSRPITGAAFSPDGQLLVSGSSAGAFTIWDFDDRRELAEVDLGAELGIRSLAFSPLVAERVLAVGTMDGSIILWSLADARNPSELTRIAGHKDVVTTVAFAPGGRLLATGSADGSVKLWRIAGGEQLSLQALAAWRQPAGHDNAVTGVAFDRGGAMLASGSADGTIRLWDALIGRGSGDDLFNGITEAVSAIAFAPAGDALLAAGEASGANEGGGRIVLWDPETREPLAGMPGHEMAVASVVFSPDAETLASGGWDHAIHLWTVERTVSDQARDTLNAHDARVTSIAFHPGFESPDLQTPDPPQPWVVSGDVEGALLVWDARKPEPLDPIADDRDALAALACEIVTRNLTPSEWQTYFSQEEERRRTCAQHPLEEA